MEQGRPTLGAPLLLDIIAAVVIHAGIFAVTWPTVAQAPPEIVPPAAVPLPAAAWLFGSALVALAGIAVNGLGHAPETSARLYRPRRIEAQIALEKQQLYHDGERWWVVTIYWTSERPDLPIPERYLSGG